MPTIVFPTSSPAPNSTATRPASSKSDGGDFYTVLTELTGTGTNSSTSTSTETESTSGSGPIKDDVPSDVEETEAPTDIVPLPEEASESEETETAEVAMALAGEVAASAVATAAQPVTEEATADAGTLVDAIAESSAVDAAVSGTPDTEPPADGASTRSSTAPPVAAPVNGETTEDAVAATGTATPKPQTATAAAPGTSPASATQPADPEAVSVAVERSPEVPPQASGASAQTAEASTGVSAKATAFAAEGIAVTATVVKSATPGADLNVGIRRFQVAESKGTAVTATAKVQDTATGVDDAPAPVAEGTTPPPLPERNTTDKPAAHRMTPFVEHLSPKPDHADAPAVDPGTSQNTTPVSHAGTRSAAALDTTGVQTPVAATPGNMVADPHAVGDQALRHVQLLLNNEENQSIRVRLVPATLGEMHLEIQRHGDTLTVRMASANPAVRDALESQMHQIQHALQKDGVQNVRVEIQQGLNTQADGGGRAQEQAQHARTFQPPRGGYTPPADAVPAAGKTVARSTRHAGNLNLFI